jgi:DNA-binding NarL/FixJ family response regulator
LPGIGNYQSAYDNGQYFFEALKAGASGYVPKSVADRDLVEACRAAIRGEPFLYPDAITALLRNHLQGARRGEPVPQDVLTPLTRYAIRSGLIQP